MGHLSTPHTPQAGEASGDAGGEAASVTARWLALAAPVHVDAAPDGTHLAVTVAHVPAGSEDEVVTIVVVDVASGAVRPLPAAGDGDHTATWSPDGGRLAFLTSRAGTTQVAVCRVDDTAPTIVTDLPAGASGPAAWSPDGTRLAVAGARGRLVDRSRPWRVSRPVQWADGIGHLDDPPQLWVCAADGSGGRRITDDEWRWSLPRWSPDGETISVRASFDPTGNRRGQHLRLARVDGTWNEPAVPGGFAVVHDWASDGSLVVLSIQPEGRHGGSEGQLHRIAPDGSVRAMHHDAPVPVGGTVYGDSPAAVGEAFESALVVRDTTVLVRTQRGGRMGVARCSLVDDRWDEIVSGDRCASPLGILGGDVVIADQSAYRPCGVSLVSRDGRARALDLVPGVDAPTAAEVRRFTVASPHDGTPLDAWFLCPPGSDAAVPTVLMIHGGPNAAFGECFLLDAQALCGAGFGVVYTNPHGSTGSGDAFTHAAIDHWGDIPAADVLAVVDEVVARGWADADRVGVAGNSYGGYLSAWLACTTERFRAAVVENPVTNLLSMYGWSDIGATFLPMQLGVTPFEDVGPYLRWSPLLRAEGCHTPVLFVVGEQDRRCPPSQAFELHRVLHRLGRTSEVLVLPGATHEGSTYGPVPGRLAHDDALVEWMRRWLC